MITPVSAATPASAMNPTAAAMEKGSPRTSSASTPPTSAKGTPAKMRSTSSTRR